MFDFLNYNELSEEIKIDEIYNLFKTESLEFNKNFLSNLEKYTNAIDFIEHYTKIDTLKINSLFNNILLASFKIMNEDNKNDDFVEFELYSYGVSKIISLLYLVKKINKLQTELIKNTKNYIQTFYINNKKQSLIKGKIDFFINDFIFSSQMNQKNVSRRSTKDITDSSFSINLAKNNNISQEEEEQTLQNESISDIKTNEFLPLRAHTPKFYESKNIECNNYHNNNNIINIKEVKEAKEAKEVKGKRNRRDSTKIDSSLTLQKMKFVNLEEKKDKNNVKKFPSQKIKLQSCNSHSHKRKKNRCHYSITKGSSSYKNTNSMNSNENEKRKILTELLDSINIFYKDGKITSKQKINMKQIIIASPNIIINKYYHDFIDINNHNIQCFLTEELQHL
jgi:hypothetical protein